MIGNQDNPSESLSFQLSLLRLAMISDAKDPANAPATAAAHELTQLAEKVAVPANQRSTS